MLSVAKLSPGQEGYYERSVAAGLDDYYAGHGEAPGVWEGSAARSLGLVGEVREGELGLLISGRCPADGTRLREHARPRTIRVDEVDPESGEVGPVERELRPVAGFDLVFGAPKSVSLLHALGDEKTRRAVVEAHDDAWQAALRYLEDEACVVRRGRGGAVRERAPGFVAAAYRHRTSRAQEPHLHTHLIVANMGQGEDGAWRALDGGLILRRHRLAAGYLYQAHLRADLTASLGVEWGGATRGMAEIAGVPGTVLREFSTRRRQIEERLETSEGRGWRSAQVAAIQTRDVKEPLDLEAARANWWARSFPPSSSGWERWSCARTGASSTPSSATFWPESGRGSRSSISVTPCALDAWLSARTRTRLASSCSPTGGPTGSTIPRPTSCSRTGASMSPR